MRLLIQLILLIHPFVLLSQDRYFYGVLPALAHNEVINEKKELNFLAASKIITFGRTYGEVYYPARNEEIYLQAQYRYHISHKLTASLGYGFQRNDPFTDNYSNEHRLIQQVVWHGQWKKLKPYQRLRTEERFIDPAEGERSFGFRFRYQAGIMLPVGGQSFIHISEEVYLITTQPRLAFFSENWLYTGLGRKFSAIGTVEVGLVYNSIVLNTNYDLSNLILLHLAWSSERHWKRSNGRHFAIRHMRQF